jgi:type IV pilus assembly protein PilN
MTQINLLPWREQKKKQFQTKLIRMGSFFAGFGLVVVVIVHLWNASALTLQLKRNILLKEALVQKTEYLTLLNKKEVELKDINEQLIYLYKLREDNYRVIKLLNELTRTIPDAVLLYKIINKDNHIELFGNAKSNAQVTLFMDNIEKSDTFEQPVLTKISGKEGDVEKNRDFHLKLEQQG